MSNKKVLVVGSGGREYAFSWKLHQDDNVDEVYCAPGNGGTQLFSKNLNININNHQEVLDVITEYDIDLTIIGPEGPLADGVVDFLEKHGARVFGPDQYASQLESSKLFARDIMNEYNIPQPKYKRCVSKEEVISVKNNWGLPLVVKADGLAAGKGVIICNDEHSFSQALSAMFDNSKFGDASVSVSVEECLFGEELSIFAVCDGQNYKILNTAQDHKRAFDDDKGPNTGGMGAYSPTPLSTEDIISKTKDKIIEPTLKAMRDKGHPYKGFLYVGIMIVDDNPYVIEFNVRMGDPETQVVIPLLKSSLYRLLDDSLNGNIKNTDIDISEQTAVTVVLASDGYPGTYQKGMKIDGITKENNQCVFHAGTSIQGLDIVSSGGRVLNVLGFGDNLEEAIDQAYRLADQIKFNNKFFRSDIGRKGLSYK